MKKKGFTLIELLAVIVILAIIALIATPIILSMINNARKSAAKSSAYGYIEAIESNNGFADADIAGYTKIIDGTHDVSEISVPMKGKAPDSGTVEIEKGKVKTANICINGFTVTYNGHEAEAGSKCSSESIQALAPGLYDANDDLVKSYADLVSEDGFNPSSSTVSSILNGYSNGKKLVLPKTITSLVPGAFAGSQNLTSVLFESGSQLTSLPDAAFQFSGLTSITLPSSITSIGSGAFQGTSLTSIIIPGNVTTIGNAAFQNVALTSVEIQNGVTTIGNATFAGTGLTSISVPSSVTSIGSGAFAGINTVYYSGTAEGSPWAATSVVAE